MLSTAWWFVGAGVVLATAALTWAARRYALHRQMVDQPGERRSHQVATPRGGGIAMVVGLLMGMLVIGLRWPETASWLLQAAAGLVLVAGIGWWDDHRPLPASLRLLVHLLAAGLLAALVLRAGGSGVQALLALLLTVSLVNIWNFMDGINGIATTQAIIAGLGFALLLPAPFILAPLLLVAVCLGFLPFNFPRARIFMGDVGSGALGYALALLACMGSLLSPVNWLVLLLPLTAFLVDAGFTLVTRMLDGQRWTQPHTQHVYQRAVKAGASHAFVTALYMLIGLLSVTVLIFVAPSGGMPQAVAVAAWWVVVSCLWWFMRARLRAY